MPTDRLAALTDAAIDVLAELGMRGLTHRAVDARAGLPQGTTSAYFRTRKTLIEAVVHRLADLDRADLQANRLPAGADSPAVGMDDIDAVAADIAAVLDRWISTARNRTLARYACLLEATHHPELQTILAHGDASRTQARLMLAAAGARHPEQAGNHLVACIDGLLFDRLAGAGARTAPPAGTAANRADLATAVATLLRAFAGTGPKGQ
ncbi:TetR family transcriptional regulator [Micromonospora sp. ATCC 39149]|uniref:TetR family transcriptional regulator n=1 Tax=Micromonospora carbonacea TaxID=47853 RepID=A0A7D6CGL3_9ACTN|nr:TetR/AcrR family transcriptional regulator [Micromonospora sp. ATCC 39149]EEP69757.1 TetR family transcriptional regulator [Micromonospora sp. ATCC 39149]QLK01080.1 TetR family transcriptional regulator [Micromonospora carbonacea]